MKFAMLVEYFGRIEETTLRNEMMEILAELLKKTEPGEVEQVVNLSLGQLRPKFDRLEFNLAEKMVLRTVAEARGAGVEEITKRYKEVGDLGELVNNPKIKIQKSKLKNNKNDLTVREVFEELVEIAREGGKGSQERKITRLARLLKILEPESGKYVVRIVAGKLRLGFSDKTILDALSYFEYGSKEGREEVERAYQVFPDVGKISKWVKEEGIKSLKRKAQVQLGTPVMSVLAQRLRNAQEMIEKMGEVIVEPKFDGTRCITGHTAVLVRRRGYITVRELRVGDEVLTHEGNFRKVTAKTSRSRRRGEKVFLLKSYMGDVLKISEGHEVLVGKSEGIGWLPIEKITDEWLYYPKPIFSDFENVPDKLHLEDMAGYSKDINLNERVMRFLGYWVGDGYSNDYHGNERVGIVCNAKHVEMIERYEDLIRKEFKIKEISCEKKRGAVMIYWRDRELRKWLCTHFRRHDGSGKQIPEWMLGIDKRRWSEFLRGWKEADGTDRSGGGYKIVTKEKQMVMMGQLLSATHGLPAGIRRIRVPINELRKKTYYELIIPGGQRYWKELKDGYQIKINRLVEIKKNLNHRVSLYDIQVERDESFCGSLVTLHNCQLHWSRNKQVEPGRQDGLFEEEKPQQWVKTFTRNLDENTKMFPELANIGVQIKGDEVILDSEAVGYDPESGKMVPFQMTITRKRKHGVTAAQTTVPLRFYVFDILFKDGKSLLAKPLFERREILKKTIGEGKVLEVDEAIVTKDALVLRDYHTKQLNKGFEGALVKMRKGKYEPGRQGWNWVKFKEEEGQRGKLTDTIDGVVMGYYKGKGKRQKFGLGAFLIGVKGESDKTLTIAKIGTGLTDKQFEEIHTKLGKLKIREKDPKYVVDKRLEPDVWVKPELIVEVAADEVTNSPAHSSGYALRFPRLVKLREDKTEEEATTIGEVREMAGVEE